LSERYKVLNTEGFKEIVNNAGDYKYSSAINYAGGIGEIKTAML
jgi:hypothetical protein